MSIVKYRQEGLSPDASVSLSDITQYSLRARSLLTALGDYWTNYYSDTEALLLGATGYVTAYSKVYTDFLDLVLSANILTIPELQSSQFTMLVITKTDIEPVYDDEGNLDSYFIPFENIHDIRYLTSSLFESRVVLEKGKHFVIEQGKGITFYVDLFGDIAITNYVYMVGEESHKQIIFWACDLALNSTIIYERYGRFLYKKTYDNEQYKWLVTALMRFYEHAKSAKCIQDVFNILYGVPYARFKDETITDIYYVDENLQPFTELTEEPYICIETDKSVYYTYAFSQLCFSKGDVVPQFAPLACINIVEDYINSPKWWEDIYFPTTLVEAQYNLTTQQKNELMDKVLKYNTVHISIGVSYDTYETYLQQVNSLFEIIESGFPVYLYPLVDIFFRVAFIEKFDVQDDLDKLRARLSLSTRYDWGNVLVFNGEAQYYMEPCKDHGSDSLCTPLTYDGQTQYYIPEKHYGLDPYDVHLFFGDEDYTTQWRYAHGHDRERFIIYKLEFRHEDHYPWESASGRWDCDSIFYDGNIEQSDGSHAFMREEQDNGNERMSFAGTIIHTSDVFPTIDDDNLDVTIHMPPASDIFPLMCYDGLVEYNNTYIEGYIQEEFDFITIRKHH